MAFTSLGELVKAVFPSYTSLHYPVTHHSPPGKHLKHNEGDQENCQTAINGGDRVAIKGNTLPVGWWEAVVWSPGCARSESLEPSAQPVILPRYRVAKALKPVAKQTANRHLQKETLKRTNIQCLFMFHGLTILLV